MRAAIRTGLLGYTFSFNPSHPSPKTPLQPNEILLQVKSSAINPVDYKLPKQLAGPIPGIDVSGIVQQVGSDVTSLQVGDAVFGRAITAKGTLSGSLAQEAIASEAEVAKKADYLTFEEGAALGTAYLTSLQSLRDAGKVEKGSVVLVIGASGGCGLAGMQLALALGASRVVGICSGKNFEFVKSQTGASSSSTAVELVDYTDEGAMKKICEENVGKFDCIYDTATGSGRGEDYASNSSIANLLKQPTGQFVQINGGPSTWAKKVLGFEDKNRSLVVTAKEGKRDLETIANLLEKEGFKPFLNVKKFDENSIIEGFQQLKERRTKGKIVFTIEE
mmetsp:Transcript_19645/g.40761  ORF Transcript_19645/g.40761 Transcript_19645/m.40761 type:complete len:334 (+) Transcript_19645:104-1105(+)